MAERPPLADRVAELVGWLVAAGLRGEPEDRLMKQACERAIEAGLPLSRAIVLIDTLHPVHEGRVVRWERDAAGTTVQEYGRTGSPETLAQAEAIERWQASPFYRLLQTGDASMRVRLEAGEGGEFAALRDYASDGHTDYIAYIDRFTADGTIGEMDCVYSSWLTDRKGGFAPAEMEALRAIVPAIALAIKAAALTRMTRTLMETYLGRDAARHVLGGRILRGVAERINAVVWFSDLRGFTRLTEAATEHIIPLLNDYGDVVISAIEAGGGDVLKLMGDGILAIFSASDQESACASALAAACEARKGVDALSARRAEDKLPVTDMYIGLHVGQVFFGNVGSRNRLDFTVVGPAVNEASRIAAMCRSVEQPILVSQAFASVPGMHARLVSVGRFALRGVALPQELFTLDPTRA